MEKNKNIKKCRVSGELVETVIDFGKQPLGNAFLDKKDFSNEYFYRMRAGFCEKSKMFQLIDQPDEAKMFHENYAFFSGTSRLMGKHFEMFSEDVLKSKYISKEDPFIVELGCNDGILLKHFARKNIKHLGVEPSKNVADVASQSGIKTVNKFFSNEVAKDIVQKYGQADAILAANVMCHISNINEIVKGIKTLLKPKGVVMFEDPYLGDIVEKNSYDQLYDEHVFLFSAHSVKFLFDLQGLELVDLAPQKTHGGSMRYVLCHNEAYPVKGNVTKYIKKEKAIGLHKTETFFDFVTMVEKSKDDLTALLKSIKADGKKIAGYAATSKSTTILNYCKIGPELVDYISDTTPIKQNKYSPGMHIPVVPYSHFEKNPPDYAILFAWNHFEEIMKKEKQFLENGGKWITHVPDVRIVGKK